MNLLASSYEICKKIIYHKLIQLCNLKNKYFKINIKQHK